VEGGLLLDVVVRKRSAVLELLAGEDESLLIGGDSFLVLDLGLDVLNVVGGLDVKSDGLASQSLDEDLHASSESEHQVKSRLLLDVVVGERATVLKLLSGEDKSLLIGGNTFLVLDLGLDVFNVVRRLNVEGNGLSGQSLDENLHASSKSEHQVEGGFLLDVVVGERSAVFQLLAGEDKSLLIGGNTFLVLDLGLNVLNVI